MTRVAVFIDYQNVYKRARETFGTGHEPFTFGQVYPRRAGVLLTQRGRTIDPERSLESVRVYRGEPSAKHSPIGQAACQRQVRYWEGQAGVVPVTRPLWYHPTGVDRYGMEVFEAREKGIDVQLAIDMVMGAMRDEYDVCILFSADTDLVPALEAARTLGKHVEVASWRGDGQYTSRLSLRGGPRVWCHWLGIEDFQRIADPTDYTVPITTPPVAEP